MECQVGLWTLLTWRMGVSGIGYVGIGWDPSMYLAIKFPQPRGIGDENDHHDYTNLLTGMILQVGGEHEFMTWRTWLAHMF